MYSGENRAYLYAALTTGSGEEEGVGAQDDDAGKEAAEGEEVGTYTARCCRSGVLDAAGPDDEAELGVYV